MVIKKALKKFLIEELLYAGHLQSLGAAGLVVVATLLYVVDLHITLVAWLGLLVSVYLCFQTIYYYDRSIDLEIDRKTNKVRTDHISTYNKYLPTIIIFLVFLLPTFLIIFRNFLSGIFIATIIFLGLLYPIFFKKLTAIIPLFKNFYVATVFGVIPIFSLLFFEISLKSIEPLFYVFMFYIFLEVLIMQVVLDIKDKEVDSSQHLKTVAVVLGRNGAIFFSLVLMIFTFLFFILSFVHNSVLLFFVAILVLFGNLLSLYFIYQGKDWGFLLEASKPIWWTLIFLVVKIFE